MKKLRINVFSRIRIKKKNAMDQTLKNERKKTPKMTVTDRKRRLHTSMNG